MPWLLALLFAPVLMLASTSTVAHAVDKAPDGPGFRIGTQEIGLTGGYLIPHRLTWRHVTKQSGPAAMPYWSMTLTDPVGEGWLRGQLSIGAEVVYQQFRSPVLSHGIGFTPKLKWTFLVSDRVRPYFEFAGGPFWMDLANRIKIREEDSEFNFILTAGFGVSWFVSDQAALNVGYRFHHISNAGSNIPNLGLNGSLPFIGFSYYY
ncbi:MAG: acyloxyacyl hydrolase [Nitrospiraceae bacterium]